MAAAPRTIASAHPLHVDTGASHAGPFGARAAGLPSAIDQPRSNGSSALSPLVALPPAKPPSRLPFFLADPAMW